MALSIAVTSFMVSCGNGAKKEAPAADVAEAEATPEVQEEAAPNTLTEAEKKDGWVLLFDGTTSEGWRGYKKDYFPSAWQIEIGRASCRERVLFAV